MMSKWFLQRHTAANVKIQHIIFNGKNMSFCSYCSDWIHCQVWVLGHVYMLSETGAILTGCLSLMTNTTSHSGKQTQAILGSRDANPPLSLTCIKPCKKLWAAGVTNPTSAYQTSSPISISQGFEQIRSPWWFSVWYGAVSWRLKLTLKMASPETLNHLFSAKTLQNPHNVQKSSWKFSYAMSTEQHGPWCPGLTVSHPNFNHQATAAPTKHSNACVS